MEPVIIATYSDRFEADLAAARLRSEGIEVSVVTDAAGGVEPQLILTRGARLLVRAGDVGRAADVLEVEVPEPRVPLSPERERIVSNVRRWIYTAAGIGIVIGVVRLLGDSSG